MAAATNPGNIGHAWVKALWIDQQAAPGMENPGEYDPADYDFIPARVTDNPIYAADENYLKTLRALPSHLKRAFLDGDWDVFAGQYFDKFDLTRHVVRPEAIDWKPWWPRWISIDWGFEHYAATYWHAAVPGNANLPIGASNLDGKTDAPSQVPADSSTVSSRAEGRSSSPAPASGAVGPEFEGSAVASNPAATSAPNPAAPSVGAQHAVPGDNTWRDVRHPATAQGDTLDVGVGNAAANIADAPRNQPSFRAERPVFDFARSAGTRSRGISLGSRRHLSVDSRPRTSCKNHRRGNPCGVRELAPAVCRRARPGVLQPPAHERHRGKPRRIARSVMPPP